VKKIINPAIKTIGSRNFFIASSLFLPYFHAMMPKSSIGWFNLI